MKQISMLPMSSNFALWAIHFYVLTQPNKGG